MKPEKGLRRFERQITTNINTVYCEIAKIMATPGKKGLGSIPGLLRKIDALLVELDVIASFLLIYTQPNQACYWQFLYEQYEIWLKQSQNERFRRKALIKLKVFRQINFWLKYKARVRRKVGRRQFTKEQIKAWLKES